VAKTCNQYLHRESAREGPGFETTTMWSWE
jgi:hypothetical protein